MFATFSVQDAAPAFRLAVSVFQNCSEELEPFVRGFLTSCIMDKNAVGSELREFYHEIIFEIFRCAPQMLLAVIPNLTQELLVHCPVSTPLIYLFLISNFCSFIYVCSNNSFVDMEFE